MTEESNKEVKDPPRDDKGKFKIKEKIVIEEKIVEQLDETSKKILTDLDTTLKTALGDEVYEVYKDYKLPERVKILQSIKTSVDKLGEKKQPIDKTGETNKEGTPPPPPPKVEPIPTLAELNDHVKYKSDMLRRSSFLSKITAIRKVK